MIELPILDPSEANEDAPKSRFWRSYADLNNDPAFKRAAQREFMPGALEAPSGASRRQFLQLMGASLALGGLTACRRPVQNILPYTRKPEDVIEGIQQYYASAMPFRGTVRGVLVESHEGRPTKIEGNAEHPYNQGGTSVFEQASVLRLYDPDRSHTVLRERTVAEWDAFVAYVRQIVADAPNQRIAVLADETSSPTYKYLREQLRARYPQLRWVTYEPMGEDPGFRGLQLATGRTLRPFYRFGQAEVIVSLDADFLGPTEVNFIYNTGEFTRGRRVDSPDDAMSRLYVVEADYTITGGMADNRLRLQAVQVPLFAAALARRLGLDTGDLGAAFDDHPYVEAIAEDLREAGSLGIVLAGETQPPEVHALCAQINSVLGSIGETVLYFDVEEELQRPQAALVAELVEEMRSGSLDTLLMLDTNPVYSMPAEYGFAEAMQQVPNTIHVGEYVDETAILSRWHVPLAHWLEAWGDGRSYDGTLSVIQPLIQPLYGGKSEIEVLNLFATGVDLDGYDLVRQYWQENFIQGDFEERWRQVLHDGYLSDSGYALVAPAVQPVDLSGLPPIPEDALEVTFHLDPKVLDGRYANIAWMQELGHPTTKITWDNVAVMGPATAQRLGVGVEYEEGRFFADIIELSVEGRAVEIPVWVQPGLPDNTISVNLGYGRTITTARPATGEDKWWDFEAYTDIYARGPLANDVGVNVAPLRGLDFARVVYGPQVGVRKVGDGYMIASTQEHGSMEGRPLFRMATLEEYQENPNFARDAVETLPAGEPWEEYPPLWHEQHPTQQPPYQESMYHVNQWGMVIDLNSCTGCHACVVACNSENNVQMVGKEQVAWGRDMHWIRIDRYYAGDEAHQDDPMMVMQPVLCMHCENAPCEQVCPVAATSHSSDGLNEMTYNRCIGTRYCSNNCPYKVRRFNFFNWVKALPTTVRMGNNPDVTVRFRGVMEKCTYCVQRIRSAQRRATVEERRITDGEVMTACQQACPAEAIVFGDLMDPNSSVAKLKRNPRNYAMLEHLDVKPRTSYLGRVRNPNPRLPMGQI